MVLRCLSCRAPLKIALHRGERAVQGAVSEVAKPAQPVCTLWLCVEDFSFAICLAGQPCLPHLQPDNTWILDPELNRGQIAVPHATLRACASRLNPRGPPCSTADLSTMARHAST